MATGGELALALAGKCPAPGGNSCICPTLSRADISVSPADTGHLSATINQGSMMRRQCWMFPPCGRIKGHRLTSAEWDGVAGKARAEVFTAMQALDYRPSLLARSLAESHQQQHRFWSSLRLTASIILAVCCAGRRAGGVITNVNRRR